MKVFTEEQKFNQSLIYIGLTISLLAVILSLLNERKKNINTSFNDTIPVLFAIIIIGLVILLFLLLKLQTKIDENGINYKFYPLQSSYKK